MGSEFYLVSRDAQRALEEFSQDFMGALTQGAVDQWSKTHGIYKSVGPAVKITFPVPVSAAGYKELAGDIKYRDLFQKSLSFTPKTWQDGVSALASVVEAPDFIGWTSEPQAIAAAAQSLPNEIIADLLEANPTGWDDLAFFHASHPVNVFGEVSGTFANDVTGAGTDPTVDNLALAMQHFDEMKAANGKPLGLRMTHVFHPPSQRNAWKKILEQDLLIQTIGDSFGAVNNVYKGAITPVCCYELTDSSKWYAAALNKPGVVPWVIADSGAPEEIRSDKDSHLYKSSLKIGLAYVLRGNGALALPHCMQRWAGTAPA